MEQLFLIHVLSTQAQDARKAANLTAVGRAVQLSLCFQNFQKATVIDMNIKMNQRSSRAVLQTALLYAGMEVASVPSARSLWIRRRRDCLQYEHYRKPICNPGLFRYGTMINRKPTPFA